MPLPQPASHAWAHDESLGCPAAALALPNICRLRIMASYSPEPLSQQEHHRICWGARSMCKTRMPERISRVVSLTGHRQPLPPCAVLQPSLVKWRLLHTTLTRIAVECDRASRALPMAI